MLAYPPEGEVPEHSVFRGLFGVVATAAVGVVVTLVTARDASDKTDGLTAFSLGDAMRRFKGGIPNLRRGGVSKLGGLQLETTPEADGTVRLPVTMMEALAIEEGDLVYVADARWWLGGVRSVQLKAGKPSDNGNVQLSPESVDHGSLKAERALSVEKLM